MSKQHHEPVQHIHLEVHKEAGDEAKRHRRERLATTTDQSQDTQNKRGGRDECRGDLAQLFGPRRNGKRNRAGDYGKKDDPGKHAHSSNSLLERSAKRASSSLVRCHESSSKLCSSNARTVLPSSMRITRFVQQ